MEISVLDPCCGGRMMWFNPQDQRCLFGDRRHEALVVTDRSRGNASGVRALEINPQVRMDFRRLPFADATFPLVVFDPPHLVHAGPRSWLAAKYGKLGADWRDDLRAGFAECFRVLRPEGVLIFKWSEVQVPTREVLALTPHKPLFGHPSGKRGGTHWITFMKPAQQEAAPMADVELLQAEIDAMRKDAARYRWLRARWGRIADEYDGDSDQLVAIREADSHFEGWDVDPLSLDRAIDAAIDAALAQEQENKA